MNASHRFAALAVLSTLAGILSIPAGGQTAVPRTLAQGTIGAPNISGDGRYVAIYWQELTSGGQLSRLIFSKDSGVNFSTPQTIVTSKGFSSLSLAIVNGRGHMCWSEPRPSGGNEILYRSLDLSSSVVSRSRSLSGTAENAQFCQVLAFGPHVLVAWHDVQQTKKWAFRFAYSADNGGTFKYDPALGVPINNYGISGLAMSAAGPSAFLVWETEESGKEGLWLARFDLAGMRVSQRRLAPDKTGGSHVAAQLQRVVVLQGTNAYFSKDGGVTFEAALEIEPRSSPNAPLLYPEWLRLDPNSISAVWADFNSKDAFYATSTDGLFFSEPINLSNTFRHPETYNPRIGRARGALIVWWSELDAGTSAEHFGYRISYDEGKNFAPVQRLGINTRDGNRYGGVNVFAGDAGVFFSWAERITGGDTALKLLHVVP